MHIKQGVKYIKLKTKPGFDFKYIHEILKRFPDTKLMIDANASYHLNKTTLSLYKKIDKFNLYCIEQPLESYDLIDHAKLQRNLVTDLALDESIESVYDLQKALELKSCRVVNIKIARVGGISNALEINKICKQRGVKTWVGGMLESPIGFYANLALSTVPNFDYPIDYLGALSYIKDFKKLFIKIPFTIHKGYLYPEFIQTGLGLTINWKLFNTFIVEKIEIK